MSRAFVKEDVDLPERSGRKRSASGLPPGATNYITARGAKRLRDELQKLRAANALSERVTELEQILASVHVVDPPDAPSNSVTFGATVTVKDKKGATETLTIVGVDELNFERDAVSWISPLGKALLAADIGDSITLEDGRTAKSVKIERKSDTGRDRRRHACRYRERQRHVPIRARKLATVFEFVHSNGFNSPSMVGINSVTVG